MKKILSTLLTFIAFCGGAWADTPELTINDVYVESNGLGVIEVSLVRNQTEPRDMQIDITIPSGFSFAVDDDGEFMEEPGPAASSAHTLASNIDAQDASGTRKRFVLSCTSGKVLSDGVVMRITIQDDGGHSQSLYSTKATNGILSKNLQGSGVGDDKFAEIPFNIILEDALQLFETATDDDPIDDYEGHIRVHRTLKPNQWNTIVLPFALDEEKVNKAFRTALGAAADDDVNVQLADFCGVKYTKDGANSSFGLIFKSVNLMEGMEAHHPYLININTNVNDVITDFLCENVDMTYSTDVEVAVTGDDGKDVGQFQGKYCVTEVKSSKKKKEFYAYLSGNNFYYLKDGVGINILGFRGVFWLNDLGDFITEIEKTSTGTANLSFFVDDDQITNIDGLMMAVPVEGVYDLQGRKVSDDLKSLKKGVYIVDGKKVMVK